jgi:integrase
MSLEIYRRGGVWHCRGTVGPAGRRKRLRQSLQTKDKDTAARQAAEIEKKYWDGHFDGPAAILTFAAAARIYRNSGKSDPCLAAVEKYLGNTLVRDITETAVQTMAKELYPRATGASLNRLVLVPTKSVINHCARSQLCSPLLVRRYEIDSKVKEPATLEWVHQFMVRSERMSHLPVPLVVALANLEKIPGRGVFGYEHAANLRTAWRGAVVRAGIKHLSPHCCRHGFATGLLRRGVDVVTVAWLGGWESVELVLKTYGHANKNPMLNDLLLGAPLTQATTQQAKPVDKTGT